MEFFSTYNFRESQSEADAPAESVEAPVEEAASAPVSTSVNKCAIINIISFTSGLARRLRYFHDFIQKSNLIKNYITNFNNGSRIKCKKEKM